MTSNLVIEENGFKIPLISIGTSPFIGASQFGVKAFQYRNYWLYHPERMEKAFLMAYEIGVPGVHVLPYESILKAVEKALKKADIIITATVEVGNGEILEKLRDMGASAVAIHAEWSDRRTSEVSKWLERISEFALSGLATHKPHITLEITRDFGNDFYMVPINPLGRYMGDAEKALELYLSSQKLLIGMKILAAGKSTLEEALRFSMKYVDAVTIGIGNFKELVETFTSAVHILREILNLQ